MLAFTATIRHSLTDIELTDLIMKTADHKKIRFHNWTKFTLKMKGIIRKIKCFIDFESFDLFENIVDQYRLLLNLSWLYSVNTVINIRSSFIQIEDISFQKSVRTVTESELVFSEDHNLLMYFKSNFSKRFKEEISYANESESESKNENDSNDEFEKSKNNLSNIDETSRQQNFQ